MSAFMCSDRHLTALAHYAIHHKCLPARVPERATVRDIVEVLHEANLRSVNTRYPDHASDEPVTLATRASVEPLLRQPLAILKAVHCYRYQSCEARTWDGSAASEIADAIEYHAMRHLPGYDETPWEIR